MVSVCGFCSMHGCPLILMVPIINKNVSNQQDVNNCSTDIPRHTKLRQIFDMVKHSQSAYLQLVVLFYCKGQRQILCQ